LSLNAQAVEQAKLFAAVIDRYAAAITTAAQKLVP
jgi:hypothetical protein